MTDLRVTLKERRLQLGISAKELAESVGLHAQQVRNWELRACYPPKAALDEVARALNLDPDKVVKQFLAEKYQAIRSKKR